MNTTFKKIIALITTVTVAASLFAFTASAANATIAFSSASPSVGQTFTVSVTLNPGEEMFSAEYYLTYNAEVLQYQSSSLGAAASGAGGTVKAVPVFAEVTRATNTFTFKTISAGSSSIAVSGTVYGKDNDITVGASANVNVLNAAKSANANLKALSLSNGTLSPKFSASRTSYTATVPYSVSECRVYATAEDNAAKVSVSGENSLKVGKNTRNVIVTAESGVQKNYTIVITRQEQSSSSEASSSDTSSAEEPENPYEVVLGGEVFNVAADISSVALPNGFVPKTVDYNGAAVSVAEDKGGNITVYYLTSAENDTYTPYVLDDNNVFKKLKYAVFGANTYIFADFPNDETVEDGYYETNIEIGDFTVKAFAADAPEMADFYYVYCLFDGAYGMYRYDKREDVLQRSPEFKFVKSGNDEKSVQGSGFISKFAALPLNGKVILIGMVLAVIIAIALIVLICLKLFKKDDYSEDDDLSLNGGFDSVTINGEDYNDNSETNNDDSNE